ncbi:hypothetical protein HDU76_013528 [Blyttiomyces sp. JEL0837]|nr:hypothetical protein HDU76_013528 [Blyttiomyces sp. JEL0837]
MLVLGYYRFIKRDNDFRKGDVEVLDTRPGNEDLSTGLTAGDNRKHGHGFIYRPAAAKTNESRNHQRGHSYYQDRQSRASQKQPPSKYTSSQYLSPPSNNPSYFPGKHSSNIPPSLNAPARRESKENPWWTVSSNSHNTYSGVPTIVTSSVEYDRVYGHGGLNSAGYGDGGRYGENRDGNSGGYYESVEMGVLGRRS